MFLPPRRPTVLLPVPFLFSPASSTQQIGDNEEQLARFFALALILDHRLKRLEEKLFASPATTGMQLVADRSRPKCVLMLESM